MNVTRRVRAVFGSPAMRQCLDVRYTKSMGLYRILRAHLHPLRRAWVHHRARVAADAEAAWQEAVYRRWITPRAGYRLRLTQRVRVGPVSFRMIRDGAIAAWLRAYGTFEPVESAWFAAQIRPGMTVLDIGANAGYFSLLACAKEPTVTVYAFEPSALAYSLLVANVRVNRAAVRAFPIALSDTAGPAVMAVNAPGNDGLNTMGTPAHAGSVVVDRETIYRARLDDVVSRQGIGRVDLIKIDVEGAEMLALRGARRLLLRADAPVILFELSDLCEAGFGHPVRDLIDYLTDCGYRIDVLRAGGLLPISAWDGQPGSAVAQKPHS